MWNLNNLDTFLSHTHASRVGCTSLVHIFDLGFVGERLIREDIYQQGRKSWTDETNAAF